MLAEELANGTRKMQSSGGRRTPLDVAAALRRIGIWCNGQQPKFKFEQYEGWQAEGAQPYSAPTQPTANEDGPSQEDCPSRWYYDHSAPPL